MNNDLARLKGFLLKVLLFISVFIRNVSNFLLKSNRFLRKYLEVLQEERITCDFYTIYMLSISHPKIPCQP